MMMKLTPGWNKTLMCQIKDCKTQPTQFTAFREYQKGYFSDMLKFWIVPSTHPSHTRSHTQTDVHKHRRTRTKHDQYYQTIGIGVLSIAWLKQKLFKKQAMICVCKIICYCPKSLSYENSMSHLLIKTHFKTSKTLPISNRCSHVTMCIVNVFVPLNFFKLIETNNRK